MPVIHPDFHTESWFRKNAKPSVQVVINQVEDGEIKQKPGFIIKVIRAGVRVSTTMNDRIGQAFFFSGRPYSSKLQENINVFISPPPAQNN